MKTHPPTYDVVIVGGGLIGLCCAAHLMGAHRKVGLVVGSQSGSASIAAAGMLAPTCEWSPESPRFFLDLLRQGRDYYPEFLARLLGDPQDLDEIGYAARPFLLLDLLERENDLSQRFEQLGAAGANVTWLKKEDVYRAEQHLNPEVIRGAIRVVGDGVVNPRALHQCLHQRVLQQCDVLNGNVVAVEDRGNEFVLTLDTGNEMICSRVVIAAGVWSYEVAHLFHQQAPVTLAKGQIIQLSGTPRLLNHILYLPVGACGCLLERAPGKYIAGTSEEYSTADVSNTSRVVAAILTRINQVFLPAGDFDVEDMWSGFRPLTPDELPIIDLAADPRIVIATGHFRNGVLLAPLTGLIVKALIEGTAPPVNLDPYRHNREIQSQYPFASAY